MATSYNSILRNVALSDMLLRVNNLFRHTAMRSCQMSCECIVFVRKTQAIVWIGSLK